MRTNYSKSTADVRAEVAHSLTDGQARFRRQQRAADLLRDASPRTHCLLCGAELHEADSLQHRGLLFRLCKVCGHLQSATKPPDGFPLDIPSNGFEFNECYPELSEKEYLSRRNRIYRPKLEWMLSCAREIGLSADQLLARRWLELGCGAGYFLSALHDAGARDIAGVEADSVLAERANRHFPQPLVTHSKESLPALIRSSSAEVLAAIFVLEHVEDAAEVYRAFAEKPAGTILLLAVPVFGFSTLLDNVFSDQCARMLDGAVHTQLYTDRSIEWALSRANYSKAAEWIFGADAIALQMAIESRLEGRVPKRLLNAVSESLKDPLEVFQQSLDRVRLADERHLLAVKR
ncbi:class I SAM-dependent methyltransferase [bacterium]|nr:class I SAM-dependent methyltransferase [bacterium]MBU1984537.1 class I SAM-dependent methyltransferase [bacterium]